MAMSTEEKVRHYQKSIDRSVDDKARLLHCLRRLSKLPVTVHHLEDTKVGRTVHDLRATAFPEVAEAAKVLVYKWKIMVSEACTSEEEDEACVPDVPDCYESPDCDSEPETTTSNDKLNGDDQLAALGRAAPIYPAAPGQDSDSKSSSKAERASSEEKCGSSILSKSSKDSAISGERTRHDRSESKSESFHYSVSRKRHSEDRKRPHKSSFADEESGRKKMRISETEGTEENRHRSSTNEAKSREKHRSSSSHHKKHGSSDKSKRDEKHSSSKSCQHREEARHEHRHKHHRSESKTSHGSSGCKDRSKDKDKRCKNKDTESSRDVEDDKSEFKGEGECKKHKKHKKEKNHKKEKRHRHHRDREEHKCHKEVEKTGGESAVMDSDPVTGFASAIAGACEVLPPAKKKIENASSSGKSNSSIKVHNKPLLPPNARLQPSSRADDEADPTSALPERRPTCKPAAPRPNPVHRRQTAEDDHNSLSRVIYAKNQRTKVFSGNKTNWPNVPTLRETCVRVLTDNLDALKFIGDVPYDVVKPVLERATPEQLYTLEYRNPDLINETSVLWQFHCNREFRGKKKRDSESWRQMYERCLDEREAKLKSLTANIKQSMDKALPVRTTKLTNLDGTQVKLPAAAAQVMSAPRNKHQQLLQHAHASKSSDAKKKQPSVMTVQDEPQATVQPAPPVARPVGSTSKRPKAPLMAKVMQAMRIRYSR